MTSAVMEGQPWSRQRWGWIIAMVFVAQVVLVYWLGERGPVQARPPAPDQKLQFLQGVSAEWLALNDPTLFALPHPQGFTASAWLDVPNITNHPFEWTQDPDWLRLPVARLGTTAPNLAETRLDAAIRLPPMPFPDLPVPERFPITSVPERSRLRLGEPLAGRALLTPFDLPDPVNSDIATNTVIQIVVDPLGRPRSFTLLSSSGVPAADDEALHFARTVRFAPLPGAETEPDPGPASPSRLTWGTLIFDWHTLPLPATNSIPSNLPPK